jgi:hypothetical protein
MGEATQVSPEPWPPEGLTLRAAIERLAGTAALAAYVAARDARHDIPLQIAGARPLSADEERRDAARRALRLACLDPVVDAWNSGTLTVMGRRGDPLAQAVAIPAPATGWRLRVADLDRSTIRDPAARAKLIFDVRFWPRGAAPLPAPSPVAIVEPVAVNVMSARLPTVEAAELVEAAAPAIGTLGVTQADQAIAASGASAIPKKNRGGSPGIWNWPDLAARLPDIVKKTPFEDRAAFEEWCWNNVSRIDGMVRGDGPSKIEIVRVAITKHRLDEIPGLFKSP